MTGPHVLARGPAWPVDDPHGFPALVKDWILDTLPCLSRPGLGLEIPADF